MEPDGILPGTSASAGNGTEEQNNTEPQVDDGFRFPRKTVKGVTPIFKRAFVTTKDAAKRAKLSAEPFVPPVETANKFAPLAPPTQTTEISDAAPEADETAMDAAPTASSPAPPKEKQTRPPPLVVYDVEDVRAFRALVRESVKDQSFTIAFGDSLARVHTRTLEDFLSLKERLSSEDAQMSTWAVGDEKTTSITVRGLSSRHTPEMVLQDLEELGVVARRARQLLEGGKPIGVFVVAVTPTVEWPIGDIKAIRTLGNQSVNIRLYQHRSPRMCHRCARYGHGSYFCSAHPRCMECAGDHLTSECQPDAPKKCVHCGGGHASYSPDCPTWKGEKERGKPRKRGGKKKKKAATPATPQPPQARRIPTLGVQNAWGRGNAGRAAETQRSTPRQRLEVSFPELPAPARVCSESVASLRVPLRDLKRQKGLSQGQPLDSLEALQGASSSESNPLQAFFGTLAGITAQIQQSMALLSATLATLPSLLAAQNGGHP
jgi:hypothetical protein